MKKMVLFLLAISCWVFCLPKPSRAEPYGSLYLGALLPHSSDISDNKGGGTSGEIESNLGYSAGLKFGYWLTRFNAPFLGLELDLNAHQPRPEDLRTEAVAQSSIDADMTVYSPTLNLLIRYPRGFIRPYAGAGGGIFFARVDDGTLSTPLFGVPASFKGDDDIAPGVQFLAGVDLFMTSRLSLFAEYRYNLAAFEFEGGLGLDMDYQVSQLNAGFTYHFGAVDVAAEEIEPEFLEVEPGGVTFQ